MTKLTKRALILLASALPINTAHQYFNRGTIVNNWLNGMNYPLDAVWYVRMLGIQVTFVIVSVVVLELSRMNKFLRIGATVFLVMNVFELGMFFYSFNTSNYAFFFSCTAFFSVLVIFWTDRTKKKKSAKKEWMEVIGRAKRDLGEDLEFQKDRGVHWAAANLSSGN
jgi:hypothetical protein